MECAVCVLSLGVLENEEHGPQKRDEWKQLEQGWSDGMMAARATG